MSAAVIQLASPERVDEAWDELCQHNRRLLDEPALLLDRNFMEQQTRLHRRFVRLFNMTDGQ